MVHITYTKIIWLVSKEKFCIIVDLTLVKCTRSVELISIVQTKHCMSAFALQSFNGVGNNWNKELNFFSKVSMGVST